MKEVRIIDRGRGPEIEGTRITVYDALPFFNEGWHHSLIAMWFNISSRQVLALQDYFEKHKDEVLEVNRKIEERIAKGNPPEVEAKLVHSKKKLQALKEQFRAKRDMEKANHERDTGR